VHNLHVCRLDFTVGDAVRHELATIFKPLATEFNCRDWLEMGWSVQKVFTFLWLGTEFCVPGLSRNVLVSLKYFYFPCDMLNQIPQVAVPNLAHSEKARSSVGGNLENPALLRRVLRTVCNPFAQLTQIVTSRCN
jgi:hypothetical protein